jgi:RNA polymerase sigma-32 factor
MQHATLSIRGNTNYLEEIRRFPMLKPEEEYTLAARLRKGGDECAADRLVTSHLRLVAKIAMGYRRCGLPIGDLISEGNIGLMQAIKGFDPGKGARFSTYATWWIKAAIQAYIIRSWSLVKMGTTPNQKKLFFNLAKTKHRISATQEADLSNDQVALIAKELDVTEQDVIEMNRRLVGDVSLNVPMSENGNPVEWQDRLVDDGPDQESDLAQSEEAEIRRSTLARALMVLGDRERQIFEARRLTDSPPTLDELAAKFRISRERVRQIENGAFQKVQRAVRVRARGDEVLNRCSRRDGDSR